MGDMQRHSIHCQARTMWHAPWTLGHPHGACVSYLNFKQVFVLIGLHHLNSLRRDVSVLAQQDNRKTTLAVERIGFILKDKLEDFQKMSKPLLSFLQG